MSVSKHLHHIKVLDLSSVLAGPLVGSFFAELGAEVIKVENVHTNGDLTKQWKLKGEEDSATSAYYDSANNGKRTELLDIKSPEGKERINDLILWADLVISNFTPDTATKLQLTYSDMKAQKEDLILIRLGAYGHEDKRRGFDAVMQAETGWIAMNGNRDSPAKMPVAMIDIIASHQMREAALLALYRKELKGEGGEYYISLYDSAISALANQASGFLQLGHIPERLGTCHPSIAPYGDVFESRDGVTFMLAVGSDAQFEALCSCFDLDECMVTMRQNISRVKNREALCSILQNRFAEISFKSLSQALGAAYIPYGKVRNLDEVLTDSTSQHMIVSDLSSTKGLSVKNIAFQCLD